MGFFRKDTEEDALKKIESINREMREISASVHLNYNMIDGRNRSKVRSHFDNIISYLRSYERIKSGLSPMDQVLLLGATVDVWNGERVGVLMWETYLNNVLEALYKDINY